MTENNRQEHLGDLSRDFAVFLPAISNFYNTFISKDTLPGSQAEQRNIANEGSRLFFLRHDVCIGFSPEPCGRWRASMR